MAVSVSTSCVTNGARRLQFQKVRACFKQRARRRCLEQHTETCIQYCYLSVRCLQTPIPMILWFQRSLTSTRRTAQDTNLLRENGPGNMPSNMGVEGGGLGLVGLRAVCLLDGNIRQIEAEPLSQPGITSSKQHLILYSL